MPKSSKLLHKGPHKHGCNGPTAHALAYAATAPIRLGATACNEPRQHGCSGGPTGATAPAPAPGSQRTESLLLQASQLLSDVLVQCLDHVADIPSRVELMVVQECEDLTLVLRNAELEIPHFASDCESF